MSRERALGVVLASTWSVDKAKWGSDKAETLSQDKVAKASSKHGSERGRVHGSGASELGGRGVGGAGSAGGRGHVDGSVVGLGLSSEDAGDKREEEDNDGLEGAHVD